MARAHSLAGRCSGCVGWFLLACLLYLWPVAAADGLGSVWLPEWAWGGKTLLWMCGQLLFVNTNSGVKVFVRFTAAHKGGRNVRWNQTLSCPLPGVQPRQSAARRGAVGLGDGWTSLVVPPQCCDPLSLASRAAQQCFSPPCSCGAVSCHLHGPLDLATP